MRTQSFISIKRSDISGANMAPEWFRQVLDEILERLNSTLEHHSTILQKQITLADNLAAEIVELNVLHGNTYDVRLRDVKSPYGAKLVWWDRLNNSGRIDNFEILDIDLVRLGVKFEVDPGTPVAVRIEIWGT